MADRITWTEADLGAWSPPRGPLDLVSCLDVHVTGSVGEAVQRLATGVAPGGTLLLVGQVVVAEERPRAVAGTGVDAVVRAVRAR